MQATPLLPQAAFESPVRHWLFRQQPVQLAGVHTHEPFWHVVPAAHSTQATPLLPQAALVSPALQVWVAASQQPFEQLAVVHTHEPLLHVVPAGQARQVTPRVPQAALVLPA